MFRFPFLLLVSFDLFLGAPFCPPPKSYVIPNHIRVVLTICENPPEICATTDGSLVLFLFYYFFPIFPYKQKEYLDVKQRWINLHLSIHSPKFQAKEDMVLTFIDMHKCVIVRSTLIRVRRAWIGKNGGVALHSGALREGIVGLVSLGLVAHRCNFGDWLWENRRNKYSWGGGGGNWKKKGW